MRQWVAPPADVKFPAIAICVPAGLTAEWSTAVAPAVLETVPDKLALRYVDCSPPVVGSRLASATRLTPLTCANAPPTIKWVPT